MTIYGWSRISPIQGGQGRIAAAVARAAKALRGIRPWHRLDCPARQGSHVNLVDSSGWLEYFADGKNASFFAPAIENTKLLLVSAVNCYEVFKRIAQQRDEGAAMQAVAAMQEGAVVDVSADLAIVAAKIALDSKLALADGVILATATGKYLPVKRAEAAEMVTDLVGDPVFWFGPDSHK